jgi:hypothetical protein
MEMSGQLYGPVVITGLTAPAAQYVVGWVGPKDGLDLMEKRKIRFPLWESSVDFLVVQSIVLVAIPTDLSRSSPKGKTRSFTTI